ncbi:MAG: 50S ribosomal protein L11 methyltransferase [Kiritimatiellae bacterium]|nr:50S ribosomal protein L11 methyltransferase [Kiritimatiellia bacterium]
MTASTDPVSCVTATLPPETAGALFEIIDSDGFTPTSWHDVESGVCRVSLFPDEPGGVARAQAALLAAAALLGVTVEPAVTAVTQADWAESWKRFFHVEKISDRVVVRPSWEPYTAQPGERVITLDPGLSFGTGKHATTQACLRFLDRLAAEDVRRSVLDMGCGSGILAIGARLLGFADVRGFDNDPDCMRVSEENAALNGVSIPFALDDLSHAHVPADIVVANILAPVLIQFAPQVAASLAAGPRARLVVSGILDEQYAAVRAAYEVQGLRQLDTLLIENWRSGLFTV